MQVTPTTNVAKRIETPQVGDFMRAIIALTQSGTRFAAKKITSALSHQARSKTFAIEANARLLLENYGDFYRDKVTNMLSR